MKIYEDESDFDEPIYRVKPSPIDSEPDLDGLSASGAAMAVAKLNQKK